MADIAVVDSDKRRIDIETFRANLGGFSVDRIALNAGNIDAPINTSYDLSGYRGLYIRVGEITADVLERAVNLEIVSTCGSGYDHVDVGAATERGVLVTHTPEAPAPGVIEQTFGFIFTLLNQLPEMFNRTSNGGWTQGQTVTYEIRDRTLGIVGLGTIGLRVARIARESFGANIVAYDPYVDGTRESNLYPRKSCDEIESSSIRFVDRIGVFEEASIVTMHVPLTPETTDMVSYEELRSLEDGYLLNLSRGGVVNEEDLIRAVENGLLRGVALDVMQSEPPDSSNPLLEADDVYITPHIAGGTEGYTRRSARINAERMQTVLEGGHPEKVVNPDVSEGIGE